MSRKKIIIKLNERHVELLDRIAETQDGSRAAAIRLLLQEWFEKRIVPHPK